MPRIICPRCRDGYIHFVRRERRYGRESARIYHCDGCGKQVVHDLERDIWR